MLKINGANAWWWWFRTADSAMFLTISQKTNWRFFRIHLLHRCNYIFHAFFFIDLIILTFHSQPTQILAKTSQKRLNFDLKDVLESSEMELAATFSRTSPRRLTENDLKTTLRRLKTTSRCFMVKSKAHLETIYWLSIYVRFKPHYHSKTR